MFVRHQIFQAAELPDKSFVKLGFKVSITFWHDMRPIWLTSLSLQRPRILIMRCSTQASLLSRTWTILRRRTGTFSPRLRSGPLRALTSVLCVWHLSFFFDSTFWSKTAGRTERIARLQPLPWRLPSFCWNTRVFRAMVRFSPFVFFYFGPTFLFPFFSISFPFLPFSTQPTITIQCFWDLRTCTRTPCSPCLSFGLKCRPARATWYKRELCLSLQLGFNWLFVLWSLDEGG